MEERLENQKRIYRFNLLPPDAFEEQDALIKEILGKTGDRVHIMPPFHCDYGRNIEVGEDFFANYNLVILDVGKVKPRSRRTLRSTRPVIRSIPTLAIQAMSTESRSRSGITSGSAEMSASCLV